MTMIELTYRDALRKALADAMAEDPSVVVIGEEVGRYGGAYGVTKDLIKEFGAERVIDVIERNHTRTAKDVVNELFSAVQIFCGDAPQSDDRTVVVVKINQLGPGSKVPAVPEVPEDSKG